MQPTNHLTNLNELGFSIQRCVLSEDEVCELISACDELKTVAAEATKDFFHGETFFGLSRGLDPFDKEHGRTTPLPGALQRVTYPYRQFPVFNKYRVHPHIIAVVQNILGDDLVQIVNQVNFNTPGQSRGWGWHQDYRFRKQGLKHPEKSYVQCLIALDPCNAERGGVRFIPGSPKLGRLKLDSAEDMPEDFFDSSTAITPELAPGDMVIFGPLTVHGSSANTSAFPRRVFINGYASAHHCDYGLPVLRNGELQIELSGFMEYEMEPKTVTQSSKY